MQVAYNARVLWVVARELQCNSLNVLCGFNKPCGAPLKHY